MRMQLICNEKRAIGAAFLLLALYVSPLFILGEDAHIRVHDNLDSNIAWYKTLIRSGEWFGSHKAVIPQIINGLPRNAYGTEFSGIVLLHALLPSMTAYAVSQAIARVFGFAGMYLLLKDHFAKQEDAFLLRVGVALAFALTPFWPSGMLSTLGQPMALWAMLHIRNGRTDWKLWLTLVLLPFYSSFVLGFFFFLAAMGMFWLLDALRSRRWNLRFLGSILLMVVIYMLIEYRLLLSLVLSREPTNRNEFMSSHLQLWQTVRLAAKNFVLGHTHVLTLHTAVILPLSFVVLYLCLGNRRWRSAPMAGTFVMLFVLSLLLSIWYAFWFHEAWQSLKERIGILNTFNFARFHFLRPLLIYLGFALGCLLMWQQGGRRGRMLVKAALIAQLAVVFAYNDEILYRYKNQPSFREFYAVEQFQAIEEFIGEPQSAYRVASIGLHPAIAQYNGFYTLDTYNNFYPLSYKHAFRKVIAKELGKDKKLLAYFDKWGGRCYLFAAEAGKKYDYRKSSKKKLRKLKLNVKAFEKLGGRYIFSALPIANAKDNRLVLLRVFEHRKSAWKVYLYEVKRAQ